MTRGVVRMPGMGPPPNPNRRRRNATVAMTKLPAKGRQGEPPEWPLPPDVKTETLLRLLEEQIDAASLDARSGSGRAKGAAERKLLRLREQFEVLTAESEQAAEQEAKLWTQLWAIPQAVAWERLLWTREVAQYVRWKVRAEQGDLDAAKEARQIGDRIGLTPLSMLRLRWEVAGDELGDERSRRAGTSSSAGSAAARARLKAVDGDSST